MGISTALSCPAVEEALVSDVHAVLRGEELNEDALYEVKDVHCLDAEVDQLVGPNHLFKRSIILIRAWCYYESCILGAHHGLISTYALEMRILDIFHLFISSLKVPLAVLCRFLYYFSKFDWENYCIRLNGPVCKSSLPNVVGEILTALVLMDQFLMLYIESHHIFGYQEDDEHNHPFHPASSCSSSPAILSGLMAHLLQDNLFDDTSSQSSSHSGSCSCLNYISGDSTSLIYARQGKMNI